MPNPSKRQQFLVATLTATLVAGVGSAAIFAVRSLLGGGGSQGERTGVRETPANSKDKPADPAQKAWADFLNRPIVPSKRPARSAYDTTPAPRDTTAGAVDAALEAHASSLLFLGYQFRDSVDAKWDPVPLPNGHYAQPQVIWGQALDANGNDILAVPKTAAEAEKTSKIGYSGSQDIPLVSDVDAVLARGVLTVKVPVAFAHVSLSADRVGQAEKDGPLSVKLVACDNDVYTVEMSGFSRGAEPIVFARDATGRRLKPSEGKGRGGLWTARVYGRVARVEVYLPTRWHEAQATVTAMGEPDPGRQSQQSPPVPNPKYMPEGFPLAFVKMTEERLKRQTQVFRSRNDAMVGYNQQVIRVSLPLVDNSAYARIDFGEKAELKRVLRDAAGKVVPCDIEHGVMGDDEGGFGDEIRFESADNNGPVTFSRAVGQVRITYPAEIEQVVLTRQRPAAGGIEATFEGSRVTLTGWEVPPSPRFVDHYAAIRGYDRTGRRLVLLNPGGFGFLQQAGFWGTPVKVELLKVTRWITVRIPYDLPPAPLLPADPWG